ncbi:hypothetical protein I7I53_05637 [Histoplasma capsulatum var. duboisii H88]|uniref:Uncharacterized protein n=1 Tax=Ajellomyces capsulatus (strain H88) TaxID=544711 RepID=A0A8A1LYI0_AJEC8|nr:hypothetical protein I7I53_05637 [Histoplasma capsulatum var. duboisii H88]
MMFPSPIHMQDGGIYNACLPTSKAYIPDDRGVGPSNDRIPVPLPISGHFIVNLPAPLIVKHFSRVSRCLSQSM